MDLGAFTESVGNFQLDREVAIMGKTFSLFAPPMDAYIAYTLPWFEVIAGLALLTRFGKLGGLIIIMVMLISFNWALGDAWSRGLNINCGCFGKSDNPTNFPLKMASNYALMLAVVVIALWPWLSRKVAERRNSYKDLT